MVLDLLVGRVQDLEVFKIFHSRGELLRKVHGANFMIAFHVIITIGHSLFLKNDEK